MTVILPSTRVTNVGAEDELAEIIVHIHARIVAADAARRTANGWLCLEVGDRLLAGDPELLVGDRLI